MCRFYLNHTPHPPPPAPSDMHLLSPSAHIHGLNMVDRGWFSLGLKFLFPAVVFTSLLTPSHECRTFHAFTSA